MEERRIKREREYVCVCVYVCMSVCMYVCTRVRGCVCLRAYPRVLREIDYAANEKGGTHWLRRSSAGLLP